MKPTSNKGRNRGLDTGARIIETVLAIMAAAIMVTITFLAVMLAVVRLRRGVWVPGLVQLPWRGGRCGS